MCGIFGQVEHRLDDATRERLVRMAGAALHHRGPDGRGEAFDEQCVLGHTRLKIIDLSDAAAQPMRAASGRSLVTFNGELYNYLELRNRLASPPGGWRTSSDTEVLIEALEQRGLRALDDFNGMFAFAWWRPGERELVLVRDRFGKKPLYWTRTRTGGLRFASEIRGLLADDVELSTSRTRVAEFLQYGYNLAPRTSFVGIEAVPAGHFLRAKLRDGALDVRVERYWDLPAYAPSPSTHFAEWAEELDATLSDAVKIRLRADVPVGAFLSGGVDSAVIALLATKQIGGLRTITVDFRGSKLSEAAHAQEVARHLGAEHRRIELDMPTAEDLQTVISTYGELHGDVSALATLAASRATREVATVGLTGDGADELMGGYTRYVLALEAAERARAMPRGVLRTKELVGAHLPPWLRGDGTLALHDEDASRAYLSSVRQFPGHSIPPLFSEPLEDWDDPLVATMAKHAGRPALTRMMAVDAETYIPGDTNPSLDRASMSVALELRSPFLDYRLFGLAARARPDWMFDGDRGKQPLRHLYAGALPAEVFTRPKLGFAPPSLPWLRSSAFSRLVENLYDSSAPIYQMLDRATVVKILRGFKWRLHRSAGRIWSLVVLDAWLRHWKPSIVS